MAFEATVAQPGNKLFALCALGSALLGILMVAGATGHAAAVWPSVRAATALADQLGLVLPAGALLGVAIVNLLMVLPLLRGRKWSVMTVLVGNLVGALYFASLFNAGVPDHPIGAFLVASCSQLILLAAIQMGLTWPARGGQ